METYEEVKTEITNKQLNKLYPDQLRNSESLMKLEYSQWIKLEPDHDQRQFKHMVACVNATRDMFALAGHADALHEVQHQNQERFHSEYKPLLGTA